MKFFKPLLILVILTAIVYTVNGSSISFNELKNPLTTSTTSTQHLPVNGDLLFAFTAIASIGGYKIFRK